MSSKIIIFTGAVILFFSAWALADTIYLKNGNKVEGIITREDEKSIEIKINIGATVSFSKEDVERVEKDADTEHARLQEGWKSERLSRASEKIDDAAFNKKQEEKGLVEYNGEWVTPDEKERLQTSVIARDASKAKKEEKFSYSRDSAGRSSLAKDLLKRGDWFIRETEHFSIFYTEPSQAKIISDKAEYYFEKIAYDLSYENEVKWDKKCQVYIVESIDKWNDFLKNNGLNPALIGGFVPNYEDKEMYLCVISDVYLAVTFPHELSHLILKEIAGSSTIPLWLNEGLANYEASITSISNELLLKYIKRGRHILLGDLLSMSNYPEGKDTRELFYAQSEKLVEFLITQHGRKKFRKFCGFIFKDKSFKDSLFAAYKEDFTDIEDFNIKLVEYMVK